MSKNSKKNFYKSEYSASFQWNQNEIQRKKHCLNNNFESIKSDQTYQKDIERNYRHRLKQVLFERLEKIEQELFKNRQSHLSLNVSIKSERKSIKSTKNSSTNLKISSEIKEDYLNDLRRSRSMALEFKHKNESTQLWWCNEDIDYQSSDTETNIFIQPRSPTISVPISKSKGKQHSFIITKPQTSNDSQSTKSSVSAQMAQATGYQSTTDDFSSFNHDNDHKSNDRNDYSGKCANSLDNLYSRNFNIPCLNLEVNRNKKSSENENSHFYFHEPYQKEDFIKDTTSSESNIDVALKSDTYRLD